MATITPTTSAEHHGHDSSLVSEIRAFWLQFIVAAFNPYRPEQHYMRGPGPAWRAKNMPSTRR